MSVDTRALGSSQSFSFTQSLNPFKSRNKLLDRFGITDLTPKIIDSLSGLIQIAFRDEACDFIESLFNFLVHLIGTHQNTQYPVRISAVSHAGSFADDSTISDGKQPDAPRLHLANNLRRMGSYYKLAVLENSRKPFNYVPLPLGMKVQFNLINQHQRNALGDGIVAVRIGDGQAPGEIEHQRQQAAFAVG